MAKTLQTTVVIISLLAGALPTHGESLSEVLDSSAMRKLSSNSQKTAQASIGDSDPDSNFASLWKKRGTPMALANWLGVQRVDFKVADLNSGLFPEYAGARAILLSDSRVHVFIDAQVPRDSYVPMARLKALQSFNRFRPPYLDAIAQQVVPIQGMQANYYRTKSGSCSLLFDIERYGVVNLRVEKCIDSSVMMQVARNLTFSRLNQKLLS